MIRVGKPMTAVQKLEAALAELQAREAARDPNYKPTVDLQKPK